LLSPFIYQVHHPWHWLTYGQNATALQTVAAIIAALAAVVAGIYAAQAYGAANTQVQVVREQLDLQRKENADAALRYREEKATLEKEREDTKARAKAQHQQLLVDEEASRPRFRNTSSFNTGTAPQGLVFKNIGESPALEVRFTSPVTGKLCAQQAYVSPDSTFSGSFNAAEMIKEGVFIAFKNRRGTEWTVRYVLNSPTGGDEVINVNRPWDTKEDTA
jgi:hypothetical protein